MVDCKESKLRFRADQLFWARAEVRGRAGRVRVNAGSCPRHVHDMSQVGGELLGYVSLLESGDMEERALAMATKMKKKAGRQGELSLSPLKDFTEATAEEQPLIPSPETGNPGALTAPRDFNLMFQTSVGAMSDAASTAFLGEPGKSQRLMLHYQCCSYCRLR